MFNLKNMKRMNNLPFLFRTRQPFGSHYWPKKMKCYWHCSLFMKMQVSNLWVYFFFFFDWELSTRYRVTVNVNEFSILPPLLIFEEFVDFVNRSSFGQYIKSTEKILEDFFREKVNFEHNSLAWRQKIFKLHLFKLNNNEIVLCWIKFKNCQKRNEWVVDCQMSNELKCAEWSKLTVDERSSKNRFLSNSFQMWWNLYQSNFSIDLKTRKSALTCRKVQHTS